MTIVPIDRLRHSCRVQNVPHNRYSPPSAPVESGEHRVPIPRSVKRAAVFFALANVLFYVLEPRTEIVETFTDASGTPPDPAIDYLALAATTFGLFMYAAPFVLLFLMLRRQAWARIALVIVMAFTFAIYVNETTPGEGLRWIVWLLDGVLDVIALGLFFVPSANRWFRAR